MRLKKLPIKQVLQPITKFYIRNESNILLAGTIGFSIATTIVTFKNAGSIITTIDQSRKMIAEARSEEQKKEIYAATIKEVAPKILPIIAFQGLSIFCAVKGKKSSDKKIKDLTEALAIAQTAISNYQAFRKEAEKELGEEKTQEIVDKVAEDDIQKNPPTTKNTLGKSELPTVQTMWCYKDGNTPNRYLWSTKSPNDIREWALDRSKELYEGNWEDDMISINEFYSWLDEEMDVSYQVPAYNAVKDMHWFADDANGQKTSDLVNIDVGATEGPDGRPINYFHCNFLPFH